MCKYSFLLVNIFIEIFPHFCSKNVLHLLFARESSPESRIFDFSEIKNAWFCIFVEIHSIAFYLQCFFWIIWVSIFSWIFRGISSCFSVQLDLSIYLSLNKVMRRVRRWSLRSKMCWRTGAGLEGPLILEPN